MKNPSSNNLIDTIEGVAMSLPDFERFMAERLPLKVKRVEPSPLLVWPRPEPRDNYWRVDLNVVGTEIGIAAGEVTALQVGNCLSVAVYRFEWDIPREAIVVTDAEDDAWESCDTTRTAGMYAEELAKMLRDELRAVGALPVKKGKVTKPEMGGVNYEVYDIPLSLGTLDALTEQYLSGKVRGWVDFTREEVTKESVIYKMTQWQLGDLGTVKLYGSGDNKSKVQFYGPPQPLLREPTPEELATPGGWELLRERRAEQKKLYEERKEHQAKVRTTYFNLLETDDTWIAAQEKASKNTQLDSILIVTVTKVEAQAVLDVFSQAAGTRCTRQVIEKKTYYNLGTHGGVPISMVRSEPGSATPGGALLTVRQAIQDLRPQAVIMCGIAFGLHPSEQHLGDILVAKQIQCYGPQKVDMQRGQIPRGDRVTSAERLLDRFRGGELEWQDAPTHFGLVLSGEKLVNDPTFRDKLLEAEPEAVGGEMEGAGLYAAARDAKVDWILVKAICDWADGKKNDDAHRLAASNAAQFVLYVLQRGGWSKVEQLRSDVMK